MKGYIKSIAQIAMALFVGVICFNSCSKDDDDDKNKKELGKSNGTTDEAFYNGYKNNKETTILIDMRTEALYKVSHMDGAINIDCESTDDAFYSNDAKIYKELEKMDPSHTKYIQLYDSKGASQFTIHVASQISKMGWGGDKVFLLASKYNDFANKFPDAIVKGE